MSLATSLATFAYNAASRGQVRGTTTRQSLRAASVQFRFENLPEGPYELVVSFVGFETLQSGWF